jgi:hypothetical protein
LVFTLRFIGLAPEKNLHLRAKETKKTLKDFLTGQPRPTKKQQASSRRTIRMKEKAGSTKVTSSKATTTTTAATTETAATASRG